MVRQRYIGLADPVAHFRALEPYRRALYEARFKYHPGSSHYVALSHAIMTLDTAANLITGHLQFYDTGYLDTGRIGEGWKGG